MLFRIFKVLSHEATCHSDMSPRQNHIHVTRGETLIREGSISFRLLHCLFPIMANEGAYQLEYLVYPSVSPFLWLRVHYRGVTLQFAVLSNTSSSGISIRDNSNSRWCLSSSCDTILFLQGQSLAAHAQTQPIRVSWPCSLLTWTCVDRDSLWTGPAVHKIG